ncbi:MAG: transglycosylase domain-containing protein [Armatimonadetes bacterium]|nr:transglycosylase domain-containing protein [Anaerolineae bacterium]
MRFKTRAAVLIKRLQPRSRRHKLLLALLMLCVVGAGGIYAWLFADLPPITALDDGLALPSTRIYDRDGALLYEILPPEQGRNTVVALADIPLSCQYAVIATEDANFYAHPGVDLAGIARALWINLRGGEVLAGGSTITQQVARTLLLDPQQRAERTVERKLKEMILALRLSNEYSKDEVLALYLNQVYFGNLAYGIEAAARAYFGKPAAALALSECALLAGLLQNPAAYDPLTQLADAQDRQAVVLDLMASRGYITAEQVALAKADTLQFAASPFPIQAPHVVMAVWTQLEREYGARLYRDGLDVVTTIDLDWQQTAQTVVQRHLAALNTRAVPANARNAALVALDPFTGQVLTMLGSPDYFDDSNSGAVNAALAMRQPGSTLKPFTYAAAMSPEWNPERPQAWTAATLVLDVWTPFVTRKLESYIPGNYGLREHGPVLVREALASSYNIPAVVALEEIGIGAMVSLAANAGLATLADNTALDLAVTLGGGEVRLLDLVQAYSIFPNGGTRITPSLILSVTVRETGESLYQWQPPANAIRVLDPRVAYLISDILSDSSARSGQFGQVSALDIARPAAAKTGTTTDYRDNWTVGYTPNLVVGIWVGNADNSPMVDVTGVSGAAPIWNDFLRQVLIGQPELEFPRPDGLVRIEICALSGLLPTPACTLRRQEWFIDGTQPTQPDTFYQVYDIDQATGLLADADTPSHRRLSQTFIVLPAEAQAWGAANGIRQPPQDTAFSPSPSPLARGEPPAALRLLSPAPYVVYQQTPTLPDAAQRVRLSAAVPPGTQQVVYQLNGQPVATVTSAPFAAWWGLQLGDYDVTAVATLADGTQQTSAPVRFSVVAYEPPTSRNAP